MVQNSDVKNSKLKPNETGSTFYYNSDPGPVQWKLMVFKLIFIFLFGSTPC